MLRDLVLFVQLKKREKHSWRSVTFSKVAGLKVTLHHECFSRFLNCTNGTKSRNASQCLFTSEDTERYTFNLEFFLIRAISLIIFSK